MSDLKISQLPVASTPLTGSELVPIVQSGVTDQTSTQAIANLSLTTSGHFTPTFSTQVNIAFINNIVDAMWIKTGNIITVQYSMYVTPTLTATLTQASVSLPISNSPGLTLAGQGIFSSDVLLPVYITTANSTYCAFSFISSGTAAGHINFSITYRTA